MVKKRKKGAKKEEKVHETVKVLEGITISKSDRWWSAALLVEAYGKRQIALYLWRKDDEGKWKRKEQIIIPSKDIWEKTKKALDEKFFSMYVRP
jgi:hypothetical protein